jgi:hypothetical protein
MVNGCAAHSSRRLLTRHLKTCSLVTLFTNKQQIPLTAKRWSTTGKTDWEVVGGENAETATDRRKA